SATSCHGMAGQLSWKRACTSSRTSVGKVLSSADAIANEPEQHASEIPPAGAGGSFKSGPGSLPQHAASEIPPAGAGGSFKSSPGSPPQHAPSEIPPAGAGGSFKSGPGSLPQHAASEIPPAGAGGSFKSGLDSPKWMLPCNRRSAGKECNRV